MRRALITGGAGFIGSNLADRLTEDGVDVVAFDNLSTGRREFVADLLGNHRATLHEADVLDAGALQEAMAGCDAVFHFQANADVRFGLAHPQRDIEQNVLATSNVLEAMRAVGCERIVFSSTGSVYGEPAIYPTPEDCPLPVQTSLYGTSKMAAEGLISSYCHGYGFTGVALRFVSVLGQRYTHGHVFDFYKSLKTNPGRLRVLGDGRQRKSYLDVGDCVSGVLAALDAAEPGRFSAFNLGTDETVVVDESVALICAHMGLDPEIDHAGGKRGWPGDAPLIHLDCSRLRATGWEPRMTIREGIEATLAWFDANPWVFDEDEAA